MIIAFKPPQSAANDEATTTMFFLLRMAFWFSLVLLFLPLGLGTESGKAVSPLQALFAAREAVGDISGICDRKPDVCETGLAAAHTIGVRAREGARIAFDMIDDKPQAADPVATGSVRPKKDVGAH